MYGLDRYNNSSQFSVTTLGKTVKSVKKGKIYYVKARSYKVDTVNNKIYGNYGAVREVKIHR